MNRTSRWSVVGGLGLALLGVWGAWVPHSAAALVLSGWDLAEYVKFLPGISPVRESFYLPVWSAGLALATVANQRTTLPFTRLALILLALALALAILPPYPHLLDGYRTPEFRWRFVLGASGVLLVALSWFSPLLPQRVVGGLLLALALAGALPALWQFFRLRAQIETVYGSHLGWGWGLGAFLIGWAVVAAAGGWALLDRSKRVH